MRRLCVQPFPIAIHNVHQLWDEKVVCTAISHSHTSCSPTLGWEGCVYSHFPQPYIMFTNFGVRWLHVQPVPTAVHHVHKDGGENLLTTAGFKQMSMSAAWHSLSPFRQPHACLFVCFCVCVCVCVCFSSFLPGTSLWGFYSYSMHPSNNKHSLIDSTSLHGFIPVITTAPEGTG